MNVSADFNSHLAMIPMCFRTIIVLELGRGQLFLVVFDPICDSQEDPQSMQTAQMFGVGFSHRDQDLFRLGLTQDTREGLQEHLRDRKGVRFFTH